MNINNLRYLLAIIEHGHFGRAAEACGVSQPTLSVQLRKLEDTLGITLLERNSRTVVPTIACERVLNHIRATVMGADLIMAEARGLRDPLAGRFRLGIIPTLAPYLLPLIFAPLRAALPLLDIEPWEDQTTSLLRALRANELDAVLLATETDGTDLVSRPLFSERFLAALPPTHPLCRLNVIAEADLAPDILVLTDGHCLRHQVLAACGQRGAGTGAGAGTLRAASLATLLNMVAAGYGTTVIPALAATPAEEAGVVLRPLATRTSRTIRIAWRAPFPGRAAVEAVAEVIETRLHNFAVAEDAAPAMVQREDLF